LIRNQVSNKNIRNASKVRIYAVATQATTDILLNSDPMRGRVVDTMVLAFFFKKKGCGRV
jgi:hypothetical protein